MKITAILAMDENRLIGNKNGLPWYIPEDLKRFNQITKGGIVIMGHNTWHSLPEKYRPLPGRRNVVITKTPIDGVESYNDLESVISMLDSAEKQEEVFIIGWASIYNECFKRKWVDVVYLTLVDGTHEWDVFVNEWRNDFECVAYEPFDGGKFITYVYL